MQSDDQYCVMFCKILLPKFMFCSNVLRKFLFNTFSMFVVMHNIGTGLGREHLKHSLNDFAYSRYPFHDIHQRNIPFNIVIFISTLQASPFTYHHTNSASFVLPSRAPTCLYRRGPAAL